MTSIEALILDPQLGPVQPSLLSQPVLEAANKKIMAAHTFTEIPGEHLEPISGRLDFLLHEGHRLNGRNVYGSAGLSLRQRLIEDPEHTASLFEYLEKAYRIQAVLRRTSIISLFGATQILPHQDGRSSEIRASIGLTGEALFSLRPQPHINRRMQVLVPTLGTEQEIYRDHEGVLRPMASPTVTYEQSANQMVMWDEAAAMSEVDGVEIGMLHGVTRSSAGPRYGLILSCQAV